MLADRSDATLSAARVFRRNQTEVRLDLVSLRKALRVVDDRHEHRCDHQADARRRHQKSNHGFVLRELGDLPIDFVELGLERRKHLHQRLANGPHRVGKVALAIVVDEGLGRARSDSLTTRPNDPPDRRDRLSAHLDEASPHHHVCAQRPPVGRQHMRFGNVAGFERPREHFGIDAIRLAAVLTDAELLDPCRIDKLDLVAPTNELVVYVPRLAARLDGDPCLGCVDGEHVVESRERTDRPSRHDLPVLHLAERDLLRAQIQTYIPHRRPLLGSLLLRHRTRGGACGQGYRREVGAILPPPVRGPPLIVGGFIPSLRSQSHLCTTQDSLPAGGPALAGRDFHPRTAT